MGGDDRLPGEFNEEIVLHRLIAANGGKAYLNGVLVPLKKLKDASSGLIDIYGQNDHIFLLQIESHLAYLDQFASAGPLRGETANRAQSAGCRGWARLFWRR